MPTGLIRCWGRIQPLVQQNADYLTNWAAQFALRARPTAEIAIVGPDAERFRAELDTEFYPNKVLCGTSDGSILPLFSTNETQFNGQNGHLCVLQPGVSITRHERGRGVAVVRKERKCERVNAIRQVFQSFISPQAVSASVRRSSSLRCSPE